MGSEMCIRDRYYNSCRHYQYAKTSPVSSILFLLPLMPHAITPYQASKARGVTDKRILLCTKTDLNQCSPSRAQHLHETQIDGLLSGWPWPVAMLFLFQPRRIPHLEFTSRRNPLFLFFSYPFCLFLVCPSFSPLFRMYARMYHGYVPGNISLQVMRDGIPQLVVEPFPCVLVLR